MDNKDSPMTYQEFLRLHASFAPPPIISHPINAPLLDEAVGGEEIEEIIESKKIKQEEHPETNQTAQNEHDSTSILTDLCRVCGNKGNISLYTEPAEKLLTFKPSRESRNNCVTIAQMISDISGEKIEKTDLLPQYICMHCLGYLQHAYNVRCRIIETTNNFKLVQKLHTEEGSIPLQLPSSNTIPKFSENQKEIIEEKEEIEGEKYWNEVITRRTAKITIAVPSMIKNKNERVTEHKCNSCGKRVYSIKSLNQHIDICIIAQLTTFFSQFQLLYQAFLAHKMSSLNYQMQALSLIYNTNKILRKIARKAKFELKHLSPEISTDCTRTMTIDAGTHRPNNRFYSPDIGYNSGNT